MNTTSFFHYRNMIQKSSVITLLFLCLISASLIPCHYTQAKTKKIKFVKKVKSVTVGKTFRYRIKNLPGKAKVVYSCNKKKLASIHKKKGILTAKKQGKVTVKATITIPGKKKKILKTTVRITAQKKKSAVSVSEKDTAPMTINTPLKNATLTVDYEIHPWNHSLVLYSSRIILDSEVKNSQLTLRKSSAVSGDNVSPLTIHADFLSLSDDGKEITYSIKNDETIKLCPGDGTANGNYTITSNLFSGELSIYYRERLTPNEVRGFVFDTSQNPLSNMAVSLYQEKENTSSTLISTEKTDEKGYYCFSNVPDGSYYIVVSESVAYYDSSGSPLSDSGSNVSSDLSLYQSGSNVSLGLSSDDPDISDKSYITCTSETFSLDQSIYCENFLLKANQPVLMCKISNEKDEPLSGVSVLIAKKDTSLYWYGHTDEQGLLVLSREEYCSSDNYTSITYKNIVEKPEFMSGILPTPDISSQIIEGDFNMEGTYEITVMPEYEDDGSPECDIVSYGDCRYETKSFSYCPEDSSTEQTFFQITLNPISVLHTDSLSVKWNHTNNADEDTESLSKIDHLSIRLYRIDGCLVFSGDCPVTNTTFDSAQTISATLNKLFEEKETRLQDNEYYLSIQAYQDANSPCSSAFITPAVIHKGILSPIDATLSSGFFTKILLFGDFSAENVSSLPCTLYELVDSAWIPVINFNSTGFESVTENYSIAYLNLSHLEIGHTYRLETSVENISLIGNCTFTITEDTASSVSPEDAIPSFQFSCSLSPSLSKKEYHIHDTNMIVLDKDYFLTTSHIKNCIYAYYLKNGIMCSTVQTDESDMVVLHPDTEFIAFFDRLQSGTNLKTSQPSYVSSIFYINPQ